MKRTSWMWLAIAGATVIILGAAVVAKYNRLVAQREAVDGAWAQVDTMLQRRADLIPNLVETVKGYAGHEQQIFGDVARARTRLLAATGPAEAEVAHERFEHALGRLLVIVERYPQLRANENFLRLQDELADSENRIAAERKRYNELVLRYNAEIRRFPTQLVAGALGFERRAYFEVEPAAKPVPKVDFGEAQALR